MAGTTRTILGPVAKQRKPTAPPPPTKAASATAPAQSEREAVRQRWRQTPPEAKTDSVRALLIDPAKRTVTEIRLPTEPGDHEAGYGTQIAPNEVEKLVGGDMVEVLDLADGEVALVDGLRQTETEELWRFGEDDAPIVGVGIVVGYDPETDAYRDTALTLEDARKAIAFEDADNQDRQDMSHGY